MNKRKGINLKASFFMTIGLLLSIKFHSKWGFGWVLSLILGFILITALWLGVKWTIKNTR